MTAPNYGCSAFSIADSDQEILMGRNYDFKIDTSSLLVHCTPKNGYESVAFAALSNISANQPDASLSKKIAVLTAPFICLDGMNEKGVSIAVLTLDSEPTVQQTGKQTIFTTLAIRLVLDRAATTQEAVDLLNSYDMFATSGRDYHSTSRMRPAMAASWNTIATTPPVLLWQPLSAPSPTSTACTQTAFCPTRKTASTATGGSAMTTSKPF